MSILNGVRVEGTPENGELVATFGDGRDLTLMSWDGTASSVVQAGVDVPAPEPAESDETGQES